MRLKEFAGLVGTSPKWVQNAAAVLGVRLGYTVPEARRLALARSISETANIQLKTAFRLAGAALARTPDLFEPGRRGTAGTQRPQPLAVSPDGAVRVEIDLLRFASGFLTRLAELEPAKPLPAVRSPGAAAMLEGLEAAEIRFGVIESSEELTITYDPAPENVEPLAAVLAAWGAYPRGVPAGLPFIMDGKQLQVTPAMRLTTVLGEIRIIRSESFA